MIAGRGEGHRGFDPSTPNQARVHNFLLGGKDNFAADREFGNALLDLEPELPLMVEEGHKFLARAVEYIAGQGVRQFVDIGSGLPVQGCVHEILESIAPGSKVVYVDNDPVVIVHGNALIKNRESTRVIMADARDPDSILDHPELAELIDLEQPTGIIMHALLIGIVDNDVAAMIVRRVTERIAPGSHILISHAVGDMRPEATDKIARLFHEAGPIEGGRLDMRSRSEVARFFDGLELVPPGLVPLPAWRPRGLVVIPYVSWSVGGVARKP